MSTRSITHDKNGSTGRIPEAKKCKLLISYPLNHSLLNINSTKAASEVQWNWSYKSKIKMQMEI